MRDDQRAALLTYFQQAHTIMEAADHFEIHYQTAWNYINELKKDGLLDQLPFRREGKTQYVLAAERDVDGVVHVQVGERLQPLGYVVSLWNQPESAGVPVSMVSSIVAYLWRRAYHRDTESEHLAGVATTLEAKAQLRRIREWLKATERVVDQLLILDLWGEDKSVLEKFGEVDPVQATSHAELFINEHMNRAQAARRG